MPWPLQRFVLRNMPSSHRHPMFMAQPRPISLNSSRPAHVRSPLPTHVCPKSLPPPTVYLKEITVVQHGLVGVIPVHALPLEEVPSAKEPGRPRSAAMGRPVSANGAARGGGGGAGEAAPLVVLDR